MPAGSPHPLGCLSIRHRAWCSRKEAAPSPSSGMFQAAGQRTRGPLQASPGAPSAWTRHGHRLCSLPCLSQHPYTHGGWASARARGNQSISCCGGQSPPKSHVSKTRVCKVKTSLKKKKEKSNKKRKYMHSSTPAIRLSGPWVRWPGFSPSSAMTCCVTSGRRLPFSASEIPPL